MTDQPSDFSRNDDTDGHGFRYPADAERTEGDDTEDAEGHAYKWADAETAEGDDTEGHGSKHR